MKPIILVKYTSRSRRDNFFRGLDSIVSNLADKDNYWVVCSFDYSDEVMFNKEVITRLNEYKNLSYYFGESESKIAAINRDSDKFPIDYSILVNFSDDQLITYFGFDELLRNEMAKNFPDWDGVLHLPDTITGDRLITMSIMSKKYYDRFLYIYFPEYHSLFCDNEFTIVSQKLNKYKFIDVSIFKHLHPAFGLAPSDEQYKYTESFYVQDGETFKKRSIINFGL